MNYILCPSKESIIGLETAFAISYDRLLSNLMVLDVVPAWLSNRLARMVKAPKRYITDPSLIGAALRLDDAAVMRDGNVMGRLLDTFVAAEIRAEAALSPLRPRIHHLRGSTGGDAHCRDLGTGLTGDRSGVGSTDLRRVVNELGGAANPVAYQLAEVGTGSWGPGDPR